MSLPGLFVVGTDTGVGKTRVAAALAHWLARQGRRVGVLKPVATGAHPTPDGLRCADGEILVHAIGGGVPASRVTPLLFEAPLAPPVAARLAGRPLDWTEVLAATRAALGWWESRADVMVVEGVGGLLCPLAEGVTIADLAVVVDYPLLIVARRGLGTLNHTLLTVETARARGIRLAGVVLNDAGSVTDPLVAATNRGELARRVEGCPVLVELSHHDHPEALSELIDRVDWYGLARRPRLPCEAGWSDPRPGS